MKAKFISKYGRPITGASKQMTPNLPMQGDGTQALNSQIAAPPMPFENPRGPVAPVGRNSGFRRLQVQGSPASGTRPRHHSAAAPQSSPMSHGAMMTSTGYAEGYRPKAGYSPVISGNPTILRGPAPKGSKPFVKPMGRNDFLEGVKEYQKQHGRI